jgi:hypothetical protein
MQFVSTTSTRKTSKNTLKNYKRKNKSQKTLMQCTNKRRLKEKDRHILNSLKMNKIVCIDYIIFTLLIFLKRIGGYNSTFY